MKPELTIQTVFKTKHSNTVQAKDTLIWYLHAEEFWKEYIKSLLSVIKPWSFYKNWRLYMNNKTLEFITQNNLEWTEMLQKAFVGVVWHDRVLNTRWACVFRIEMQGSHALQRGWAPPEHFSFTANLEEWIFVVDSETFYYCQSF